MASAAVNRAEIEKIVRKVVNEQQQSNGQATLKAIRHVSDILTDEVIPNLPEKAGDGEAEPDDISHSGKSSMSFGARAVDDGGVSEGDEADDTESPNDSDDSGTDIPPAVLEAYKTLSHALTAEQADALSAFFAALSAELEGSGDESPSDSDDVDDAIGDDDAEHGTRAALG